MKCFLSVNNVNNFSHPNGSYRVSQCRNHLHPSLWMEHNSCLTAHSSTTELQDSGLGPRQGLSCVTPYSWAKCCMGLMPMGSQGSGITLHSTGITKSSTYTHTHVHTGVYEVMSANNLCLGTEATWGRGRFQNTQDSVCPPQRDPLLSA